MVAWQSLRDSGVNRVQVSIDGARAASHETLRQKPQSFERAIAAIVNFREAGFSDISVAFCPTAFNFAEVEDAYNLCARLGVKDFRVQPLMLLGRSLSHEHIVPSSLQYRALVSAAYRLKFSQCTPAQVEWGDPVDHLIRFRTVVQHCVAFANIKADGSIDASPYIPLIVGNVRKHRFSEYWDAGLPRIWERDEVKRLAARVLSVVDMGREEKGIPRVWHDEPISIDIIDTHLFQN